MINSNHFLFSNHFLNHNLNQVKVNRLLIHTALNYDTDCWRDAAIRDNVGVAKDRQTFYCAGRFCFVKGCEQHGDEVVRWSGRSYLIRRGFKA